MGPIARPVLLDSVILIDHFNGIEEATEFLNRTDSDRISPITRAEVLVGFSDASHRNLAAAFLDQFSCLSIDAHVADRAADMRRSEGWKLPDAFQAALALHHGLPLATRNTKDFSPDRHAFVEVPYRL